IIKMGVTRLKRKDRRNKTVSRVEVQFLKLGTNVELGSRSKMKASNQIVKNDAILNQLAAEAK
ncbi:MAG: spore protein, partial [Sphingobacterium sp.]|nr:spore protein [Sphingobacterium sp.]